MVKKTFAIFFPSMRISFALVLLSTCILLGAEMLGITPEENRFHVEARSKVSEMLALQLSGLIPDQDLAKIHRLLRQVVKRNPEILSAGIRSAGGDLVFHSPDHAELWGDYRGDKSTSSHVFVPIFQDKRLWGKVELRFEELSGETLLGIFDLAIFKLVGFFVAVGFFVYLFFMLRTLKQLDPSAIIPDRVNAAFDTLAEGVLIIDEDEQIVLANKSISEKLGLEVTNLLGKPASELAWRDPHDNKPVKSPPWRKVLAEGKHQVGVQLSYLRNKKDSLKFALNASPILGPDDRPQGVLVTLDDISNLEQRNRDLKTIVARLQKTQFQVQQQNKELTFLATRDPMTGCLNRRSFGEQFDMVFSQAQQSGDDLCCIMADIDHFKAVNDNFGHATGDEVIKMLAEILKSNTRKDDLVGRYGGEEFCLVLPGMEIDVALKLAERMRLRIKDESARRYPNGPRVTASLGVASIRDNPSSPEHLNQLADEALYIAKETGRNRVVRWTINADTAPPSTNTDVVPPPREEENIELLRSRIMELEEIATNVSAELEYSQNYDKLTGLPNQVLFYDRIMQAVERGYRHDQLAAVLIIDIEAFSRVNTTLGRDKGDLVLGQFAERLNHIFRRSDGISRLTVSRFAGDEFALLLTDISRQEHITWAVKRLLDSTQEPLSVDGNSIHLAAKVGISLYPTDANSVEELFNHAMTAKKYCKQNHTGQNYQFYDQHMQEQSLKYISLEKELFAAIERKEWRLYYQPKLNLANGQATGVEGLIRWQHPARGLLTPYEFIDFAERRKLINPIGKWVIEQACVQIAEFIELGIKECRVAINLSPVQLLQDDLISYIFSSLDKHQIPPRLLEIEITENALVDNLDNAAQVLERLSARGIRIAIDDFGTGYSSLNYLKNLPISVLKIDRTFIKDVCEDNNDEKIVGSLIAMAHSLDLQVVAEGVETREQLELLNRYGCDEIQGFLFSKPVAANEVIDIIRQPAGFLETSAAPLQIQSG